MKNRQLLIEKAWEDRSLLEQKETQNSIREIIALLDEGKIRIAEPINGSWQVNEWLRKAVILYFPIQDMEIIETGPF